jgi:hypothetical protein
MIDENRRAIVKGPTGLAGRRSATVCDGSHHNDKAGDRSFVAHTRATILQRYR